MKTPTLIACFAAFILCSCSNNSSPTLTKGIDVATGLNQPTSLKLSDFGKSIRYIPLETTDDCLIGNNPDITVLKDKIVIVTQKQCMVFDKTSGKFINSVGHIGEDPEGYSGTVNWVDENKGIMYFHRQPNQLVKYKITGEYIETIPLPESFLFPSYMVFTETDIVTYYTGMINNTNPQITLFGYDGNYKDSIPSMLPPINKSMKDLNNISVIRSRDMFGNWSQSGVLIFEFKDNKQYAISPNPRVLWSNNNKIRFKEEYGDTIYNLNGNSLEPYLIFNTGDYHWPVKERTSAENNRQRIIIPYIIENDESLFFQCILGLYEDDRVVYNGMYDKNKGTTKIAKYNKEITDDINSFMPFKPHTVATTGEYVGMVESANVIEWIEKHPEAKTNKELSFLNELTEDMNPVIILVGNQLHPE